MINKLKLIFSYLKKYQLLIRWIVAAACIVYIVNFFINNQDEIKLIKNLSYKNIILILVIMTISQLIQAFRFRIVLHKCSEIKIHYWPWFRASMLASFLNTFIPQGGNIYRSIYLKSQHSISYTRYAAGLFAFLWLDTLLNLIFAMVIIVVQKVDLRFGTIDGLLVLFVITVAGAAVPPAFVLLLKFIKIKNRYLLWLHSKISEMLSVAVQGAKDLKYLAKIILTGMIAFTNTVAIFYFCFSALNISASIPALGLFYILLRLCTLITITPGNLGIREILYGILGDQIHLGKAQGIIISIIIRILGTFVVILFGSLFGGIKLLKQFKNREVHSD